MAWSTPSWSKPTLSFLGQSPFDRSVCKLVRLVLIFMIANAVNACWVMEQPAGSSDVLPCHSRLSWYFNECVYVAWLKPQTHMHPAHMFEPLMRPSDPSSGCAFTALSARNGLLCCHATATSLRKWRMPYSSPLGLVGPGPWAAEQGGQSQVYRTNSEP